MSEKRSEGPSVATIPEGDNRTRLVCPDCGYIAYENPKVVVGAICRWQGEFLLCRRSIAPRKGYWTFPAGFMETGETMAQGAAREALEEACADVRIDDLLGIYEVPEVSHIYVIFTASLLEPTFAPGDESLETRLFTWEDIPWDDLAFPSIKWALQRYREGGGPHLKEADEGI